MATTAIWDVRGWLGQVVHYVANPEKTENPNFTDADIQGLRDVMNYATQDYKTELQFYVSGINCMPETARQEMLIVKKQFNKEGGIVAFHGYMSFAPGEVTPDLAHELGMKLAQELWGDRFQVIVATHLDKQHIHEHFVLNSVSFLDGKRYNDCKTTYDLMRRTSDRLCREYVLSVIENPKRNKRRSYTVWQAEREGKPTWWSIIREDVDTATRQSISIQGFLRRLNGFGYEVKSGKYISVRPQGKERFVRLKTLGDEYTEKSITDRILANPISKQERPGTFTPHPYKKLKGIKALYYHYLYLLGVIKKKEAPPKYNSYFIEDLIKFDRYAEQAKFLNTHNIDTMDDLLSYKSRIKGNILDSLKKREQLYKVKKDSSYKENVSGLSDEITGITKTLKMLRKELRICEKVEIDSLALDKKLQGMEQLDQTEQNHQRSKLDKTNIYLNNSI